MNRVEVLGDATGGSARALAGFPEHGRHVWVEAGATWERWPSRCNRTAPP